MKKIIYEKPEILVLVKTADACSLGCGGGCGGGCID